MKKNPDLYVVILAGGGGTRLWPVSRKKTPKHILPFIGKKTLLQTTFGRIQKVVPKSRIYVVTNIRHAAIIRKQLPGFSAKQILCEPEKKDTAAALGFAAAVIASKNPDAIIATAWSDGFIPNEKRYRDFLLTAAAAAHRHPLYTVLIGVKPTYPETGYGYIKIGKQLSSVLGEKVFHVARFFEKPDLATAKKYVDHWEFLWNPGMFVWNVTTLLSLYKKFLPKHYSLLKQIQQAGTGNSFSSTVKSVFKKFVPISIDYGIIEKTNDMLVIPGDFQWADVGHWRSVKDVLSRTETENVIKGFHLGVDTEGSLIYGYSKRLIATIGMKDVVIIDTPDVLLVCPKDRSQDVKKIVEKLQEKGLKKYV